MHFIQSNVVRFLFSELVFTSDCPGLIVRVFYLRSLLFPCGSGVLLFVRCFGGVPVLWCWAVSGFPVVSGVSGVSGVFWCFLWFLVFSGGSCVFGVFCVFGVSRAVVSLWFSLCFPGVFWFSGVSRFRRCFPVSPVVSGFPVFVGVARCFLVLSGVSVGPPGGFSGGVLCFPVFSGVSRWLLALSGVFWSSLVVRLFPVFRCFRCFLVVPVFLLLSGVFRCVLVCSGALWCSSVVPVFRRFLWCPVFPGVFGVFRWFPVPSVFWGFRGGFLGVLWCFLVFSGVLVCSGVFSAGLRCFLVSGFLVFLWFRSVFFPSLLSCCVSCAVLWLPTCRTSSGKLDAPLIPPTFNMLAVLHDLSGTWLCKYSFTF